MEYSVSLVNGQWVMTAWSDDLQCWSLVCRDRKQAEKIAQAYSCGSELHIVVEVEGSIDGDIYTVVGTCSRARDTRRIINKHLESSNYRGGRVTSWAVAA